MIRSVFDLFALAVLFLALLVARPQLEGGGFVGSVSHHVVMLDDSASMQQRSGYIFTRQFLEIQHKEATWWRDACLAYFQSVNGPLSEFFHTANIFLYRSLYFENSLTRVISW